MQVDVILTQLNRQAETIHSMVAKLSPEQYRWKPAREDWSILEVINHLLDEEIEDFRTHLDDCLHHPDHPWHPIDPQGWVKARSYNRRDPGESLGKFLIARNESVVWLSSLEAPDWNRVYQAPWGTIRAGDLMAAWLAHDLLHTRQLVELLWAWNRSQTQPFQVEYAGDW